MKLTEKQVDEILDCVFLRNSPPLSNYERELTKIGLRERGLMEQSALEKARELRKMFDKKHIGDIDKNIVRMIYLYEQAIKELQEQLDENK